MLSVISHFISNLHPSFPLEPNPFFPHPISLCWAGGDACFILYLVIIIIRTWSISGLIWKKKCYFCHSGSAKWPHENPVLLWVVFCVSSGNQWDSHRALTFPSEDWRRCSVSTCHSWLQNSDEGTASFSSSAGESRRTPVCMFEYFWWSLKHERGHYCPTVPPPKKERNQVLQNFRQSVFSTGRFSSSMF